MKLVLIPCAASEWRRAGRLLGRVELTLCPAATEQLDRWVERLRTLGLQKILHSPDELCTDTAKLLASRLGVPSKSVAELSEVDVGLWAGLTEEQLRMRYSSAHRELCDAPLNVTPPEGESLNEAAHRVATCVRRRVGRNGQGTVGLVLRPLSLALLRAELEGGDASAVWRTAQELNDPVVLDTPAKPGNPANGAVKPAQE